MRGQLCDFLIERAANVPLLVLDKSVNAEQRALMDSALN
jgi:hypothetical protein